MCFAANANFSFDNKYIKNKKNKVCGFVCKYSSVTWPIINTLEFWLWKRVCVMKVVNWMLTEVRHKVDLIKNNHVNYLLRLHIIGEAKRYIQNIHCFQS